MAAGRKPKPTEQRRREGNPGKRPMPEPVTVQGRPGESDLVEPPEHMPADAKAVWREVVPALKKVGILDNVDAFALEAMCTQYARAKAAGRVITRRGMLTRGSTGQLRENPALATERAAHKLFLQFCEQYALTPTARTRLGLAELQRVSLAEELKDLAQPDLTEADAEADGEEIEDAEVVG